MSRKYDIHRPPRPSANEIGIEHELVLVLEFATMRHTLRLLAIRTASTAVQARGTLGDLEQPRATSSSLGQAQQMKAYFKIVHIRVTAFRVHRLLQYGQSPLSVTWPSSAGKYFRKIRARARLEAELRCPAEHGYHARHEQCVLGTGKRLQCIWSDAPRVSLHASSPLYRGSMVIRTRDRARANYTNSFINSTCALQPRFVPAHNQLDCVTQAAIIKLNVESQPYAKKMSHSWKR